MSKKQKFYERLFRHPTPNDISFDEMARFLLYLGCIQRKSGSSHRHFNHPNFPEVITLMEEENVKEYKVIQIKRLVEVLREEGLL